MDDERTKLVQQLDELRVAAAEQVAKAMESMKAIDALRAEILRAEGAKHGQKPPQK